MNDSKANMAGKLGETFAKIEFGFSEPAYEVKTVCRRRNSIQLIAKNLLCDETKVHVIIVYQRKVRQVTRGPRRGLTSYTESLQKGFRNNLKIVLVLSAHEIIEWLVRTGAKLRFKGSGRNAWQYVYHLQVGSLMRGMVEHERTEGYRTMCFERERHLLTRTPF